MPGSARRPCRNLTAEVGPPSSVNAFFHGLGGFLPFPICLARDAHTLKAVIYYRPLRSPCPRADAARVGIQRDVPVKIWWHLVMLGSDRLKRADTVPDTTIRMRSENRDSRQLHCLETVSPRRAGELRDRGLHEPVSAGPHCIRICGKHVSRQKCCTQDQGLTNNRHMTSSSVSIGKSSGGNGAVRLGNV